MRPFRDEKQNKEFLAKRLYIMNIPYDATMSDVRLMIEEFAEVEEVVMPRNYDGYPHGYAFVFLKQV